MRPAQHGSPSPPQCRHVRSVKGPESAHTVAGAVHRSPAQHASPMPPQLGGVTQVPPMHVCPLAHDGQHAPAGHPQLPATHSRPSVHAGQHAPAGHSHVPATHSRPSVHAGAHVRPASGASTGRASGGRPASGSGSRSPASMSRIAASSSGPRAAPRPARSSEQAGAIITSAIITSDTSAHAARHASARRAPPRLVRLRASSTTTLDGRAIETKNQACERGMPHADRSPAITARASRRSPPPCTSRCRSCGRAPRTRRCARRPGR